MTTMEQLYGTPSQQIAQLAQFSADDEVWEHPDTRTCYVGDAEGEADEYILLGTVATYRQELQDLIDAR